MIKSIIVAKSKNHVIGNQGKLPWHLPNDLQFFQQKTWGHHVIMGRKTYDSLFQPLKNRTLVVVTRKQNFKVKGGVVVQSLQAAFNFVEKSKESEVFIAGGGDIYKQTLHLADRIYCTLVDVIFPGDTYFPVIDKNVFLQTKALQHTKDEKHAYNFCFEQWERH